MSRRESRTTVVVAPGLIHPGPRPTVELMRLVNRLCGHDERIVRLRRPGTLPRILASAPERVVLYMHRQGLSETWVTALGHYVEAGGALLALHSASASLKGNLRYGNLLGGVFSGHGPVTEFTVEDSGAGITKQPFTVRDERYAHRLTRAVRVLLTSDNEPVCWTHLVGSGHVAYLSLGHCAGVFTHPAVRSVVEQLWEWNGESS